MRDARSRSFNPEINVPPFSFFLPFFLFLFLLFFFSRFSSEFFLWPQILEAVNGINERQGKSRERERRIEGDGEGSFFSSPPFPRRDGKASSQVRNATKYRIREFASSFSSSRMRGEFDEAKRMIKDERVSGNAKRDELPSLGAFSFHLVSSSSSQPSSCNFRPAM